MRSLAFILLTASVATLLLTSCKKQEKKDDEIIKTYLENNQLNATKTESGLYYIITEEGAGDYPNIFSWVTVDYKGYFTDGEVFDQSDSSGVTFPLSNLILGWQEGLTYFKEGGEGQLLVPSALGYGERGAGTIPGNTVILFDIRLIEVN